MQKSIAARTLRNRDQNGDEFIGFFQEWSKLLW